MKDSVHALSYPNGQDRWSHSGFGGFPGGFDLELAVERGHGDAEHFGGFLAGSAVEFDGFFDVPALLLADVLVEGLANGEAGGLVLGVGRGGVADDVRGKIGGADDAFLAESAGALDRVFQLANIARPAVAGEDLEAFGVHLPRFGAGVIGVFLDEMVDEQRHVFETVAQGGHLDGDDREAVVKVFAEGAFAGFFQEGLVRRGEDTDIDRHALGFADAANLALLEDAQELGLEGLGHGVDFIQEDGAALGFLEEADLVLNGAGEGAFFMAKEFGLEEVLGEGGAIDGDEGLVLAGGVEMEGAGDQFLAGAAFALDEDGGVGIGYFCNEVVNLLHARTGANDVLGLVLVLDDAAEVADFALVILVLQGALHGVEQFVDFEGLDDVIEGAGLEGHDGGLNGLVGGDHDEGSLGEDLATLLEDVQTADFFHLHVADDQFWRDGAQALDGALAGVARDGVVTTLPADGGDDIHHRGLIIDDHDSGHKLFREGFGVKLRVVQMAVFASVEFIALLRKWKAKNSTLIAFEGSILSGERKRPPRTVPAGKNATGGDEE